MDPGLCQLLSKDGRLEWEENFAKRYITPVLKVCAYIMSILVCCQTESIMRRKVPLPLNYLFYSGNSEIEKPNNIYWYLLLVVRDALTNRPRLSHSSVIWCLYISADTFCPCMYTLYGLLTHVCTHDTETAPTEL